ncbi:MAG: cell division protein ZapA [Ruminococcus sp.]|nr:cell division protein ZapA [Ruminococcus sp.]
MSIENKVRVNICGKDYNLRTDDEPEYLLELAERVDREINELTRSKPGFGVQNAAVFVALTSLDTAYKAGQSIANVRTQIKAYVDDAAKARAEKAKLSARLKELEEKISDLEKENAELKKRAPLYECEQLVMENTITPAVTVLACGAAEEAGEKKDVSPASEKTAAANEPPSGKDDVKQSAASLPPKREPRKKTVYDKPDDDGDGASSGGKTETREISKGQNNADGGGRKNAKTGNNDGLSQQNGMNMSSLADFVNKGKTIR